MAKEGNLQAPTRHALDWHHPEFYSESALNQELERVFDLCHGCRRCVSLCQSFPTLFDLVDNSPTFELDGVDKADFSKVVDECYLCDLCYMTKCPYTPPHEWNIDFPHLMLRAKAVKFKQGQVKLRDKILTSTDAVAKLASIPIISNIVNGVNKIKPTRVILDKVLGVHPDAKLPEYHSQTLRHQLKSYRFNHEESTTKAVNGTSGKVVLFTTCYGNYNAPDIGVDLVKILEHNDITVRILEKEQCCGMPKLELGDLEAVEKSKNVNIPPLAKLVAEGWDILTPIPSCTLMFKQELPLIFPDDPEVIQVQKAMFDPFEYLMLRHQGEALKTDFQKGLGVIAYHVACHQRVQNIGMKTQQLLKLIADTEVKAIMRCSGHDGTYAVKSEFHQNAVKIGRPVAKKYQQFKADYLSSDCPMAATHIENIAKTGKAPLHPIQLLRLAYGI